jgi:hypothetical protein
VRSVLATAVALCALALPSTANATHQWYWTGNLGPGDYDPNCWWYYGQAVCSGWNYWHTVTLQRGPQNGAILLGFENQQRIRGVFEGPDVVEDTVTEGEVGICCYLIAHATWWNGLAVDITVWSHT